MHVAESPMKHGLRTSKAVRAGFSESWITNGTAPEAPAALLTTALTGNGFGKLILAVTLPVTGKGSGLMMFMGAPPSALAWFWGMSDNKEPRTMMPKTTLRDLLDRSMTVFLSWCV